MSKNRRKEFPISMKKKKCDDELIDRLEGCMRRFRGVDSPFLETRVT